VAQVSPAPPLAAWCVELLASSVTRCEVLTTVLSRHRLGDPQFDLAADVDLVDSAIRTADRLGQDLARLLREVGPTERFGS
jgi:hypothetical protein